MTDNAAIWVVDANHQNEAQQSQDRLRRLMPAVEILHITPNHEQRGWYADYIHALIQSMDLPYKKFIFFDSDTWLVEPIDDVYEVLDHYPLAGIHAPARWTCPTPYPIPEAFPELNTGVLGYSNTVIVRELFKRWYQLMIDGFGVFGDNDQGSLRVALWELNTPIWIMPPEYNCRFGFGGFAGSPVKVLHGRGVNFEAAAKVVNYSNTMRTWTGQDFK